MEYMGIHDIGGMASQYKDPETGRALSMEEAYRRPDLRFSPREDRAAQREGHADAQTYHDALRAHIRQSGIANPISWGWRDEHDPHLPTDLEAMVVNGHHRYFAGRDEGLTQFPVKFQPDEPSGKMPRVPGWDKEAAARWTPSSGIFAPTTGLDHRLFGSDSELRPEVRQAIMQRLDRCLRTDTGLAASDWQDWLRVYIAGGSASEWAGNRPNDTAQDLDVLIGADYAKARSHSPALASMDDAGIDTALNAAFRGAFNAENVWLLVGSEACHVNHSSMMSQSEESSSATGQAESRQHPSAESMASGTTASSTTWGRQESVLGYPDPSGHFSQSRSARSSTGTPLPLSALPTSPTSTTSASTPSAGISRSMESSATPSAEDRTQPTGGGRIAGIAKRSNQSLTDAARTAPAPTTGSTTWSAPSASPWKSTSAPSNSREAAAPSVRGHSSHQIATSRQTTITDAVQGGRHAGSASGAFSATTATGDSADSAKRTLLPHWTISSEQPTAPSGYCWVGPFSATAYANPNAWDIKTIKPYAAYDVTDMEWAVRPPHLPEHSLADFDPALLAEARAVAAQARAILRLPEPMRTREARSLWEKIHADRSRAFSAEGEGWQDAPNVVEKWLAYAPGNLLGHIRELALAKTAGSSDPGEMTGNWLRALKTDEAGAPHHGPWYHGTRADLQPGDEIAPGHDSESNRSLFASEHAFFTSSLEGAHSWARSRGDHTLAPRVYEVTPLGEHELDPEGDWENDRRSVHPLRVVREIPHRYTAALAKTAVLGHPLENPYHGGTTWFHGSRTALSPEDMTRGYQMREEDRATRGVSGPQFNKMLGTHFDPLHEVAHHFTTFSVPSAIHHAELRFRNPAHFESEDHLLMSAFRWASQHHPAFREDIPNTDKDSAWNPETGPEKRTEHLMRADREMAPDDPDRRHKLHHMVEDFFSWHPKAYEMARGFAQHLQDQGHHGITYGNEVEGPRNHVSAIATDPSQIHVTHTERIHPESEILTDEKGRYRTDEEGRWIRRQIPRSEFPAGAVTHSEAGQLNESPEFLKDVADRHHPGIARLEPHGVLYGYPKGSPQRIEGWHYQAAKVSPRSGRMPIGDVLALESVDYPGQTVAEAISHQVHSPWTARIRDEPHTVPPVHIAPAAQMAHDLRFSGNTSRLNDLALDEPDRPLLGNGHHRVAEMLRQGWTDVPWTSDMEESDRVPEEPFHREAALHNPVTQDMNWFHGSDHSEQFERFDPTRERHGHETGELDSNRWWNSRLGPHFTSEHHVATDLSSGMGGGNVYHARLDLDNPKHYASEEELGHAGHEWARKHGYHVDVPHARDSAWDDALTEHPQAQEIANGFRSFLQSRGHDGITYGNQYEGTRGHLSAIAFDPDQVHIRNVHRTYGDCEQTISCPGCGESIERSDPYCPHCNRTVSEHTASVKAVADDDDGDRYVTCGQGHQHWGAYGAAGLLIRHQGDDGQYRYLLQKRSDNGWVDHPGTWSIPGGALHEGESPEDGAQREAEEEMGGLPRYLTHHHTFSDDHGRGWAYHTVVMDSPRRFTPGEGEDSERETDHHGWFTPNQVKNLNLHPGFAASWDKVRKSGAVQKSADRDDWPAHWNQPPERRTGRPGEFMYRRQTEGFHEQTMRAGIPARRNAGMLPGDPEKAVYMTTDDHAYHALPEQGHPGTDAWREHHGHGTYKIDVSGLPLVEDRTYTNPETGEKRSWMATADIGPERVQPHEPGSEHGVTYDLPGGERQQWLPPRQASVRAGSWSPLRAWAAEQPHKAVIRQAQDDLRAERPELTAPLDYRDDDEFGFSFLRDADSRRGGELLHRMLEAGGYPPEKTRGAFVMPHPHPEWRQSQVVSRDGHPGVALLWPSRWDAGTLAHEAGHLLHAHYAGHDLSRYSHAEDEEPAEEIPDAEKHGPEFARHYATALNVASPGAGDDFLAHHADAMQLVSNYRKRVHGLPAITAAAEEEGPWYHGTNVDIGVDNLIDPGHQKNFGEGKSTHVYFTESESGARGYASWAVARRGGEPHVYEVEPERAFRWEPVGENRPAQSPKEYKSRNSLRVLRELPAHEPIQREAATGEDEPKTTIRMVPPEEYGKYVYPDYPRARTPAALAKHFQKTNPAYWDTLRSDIEQNGVQAPVLVRYRMGGRDLKRPSVMDGHNRAAAAWSLGLHIPVGDYDNQADYDAARLHGQQWFQQHHELKAQGEAPWRKESVKGYDLSPRSGMIYLDLPEGLVHQLPDGVDDHHITLVYLGKDVDDEAFAEACRRAQEAAAAHHPMEGILRGVETFPPSDASKQKVPAFVPAYVPGIGKLRQVLEDLSASEHKHYRPHVTLGYYQEGEELPPPHPTVPVRFDRLHVKRGNDVVSFPLGPRE